MANLVVVDNKVAIVNKVINGIMYTDTLEPMRIKEKQIFTVNQDVFGKYFTMALVDEELAYALTIILQENVKDVNTLLMHVDLEEVDEDLSVVGRFEYITTDEFLCELVGKRVTQSASRDIVDMIESTRLFALSVVENMTNGTPRTMFFDENLDIDELADEVTENLLHNEVSINYCDTACIVGYENGIVHYVDSETLFGEDGYLNINTELINKLDVHALHDLAIKIENN